MCRPPIHLSYFLFLPWHFAIADHTGAQILISYSPCWEPNFVFIYYKLIFGPLYVMPKCHELFGLQSADCNPIKMKLCILIFCASQSKFRYSPYIYVNRFGTLMLKTTYLSFTLYDIFKMLFILKRIRGFILIDDRTSSFGKDLKSVQIIYCIHTHV